MNTKHKYYEYIVAFAEGKEVEYTYSNQWPEWWRTVKDLAMFDCLNTKFRIKPEVHLTAGYRRYVWKSSNEVYRVDVLQCGTTDEDIRNTEKCEDFVRWIDDDRVYEEVQQ